MIAPGPSFTGRCAGPWLGLALHLLVVLAWMTPGSGSWAGGPPDDGRPHLSAAVGHGGCTDHECLPVPCCQAPAGGSFLLPPDADAAGPSRAAGGWSRTADAAAADAPRRPGGHPPRS